MAKAHVVEEYPVSPGDPLAAEHANLTQLHREVTAVSNLPYHWYQAKLKEFDAGKTILAAPPEQARLYVLAAAAQVLYFHEFAVQTAIAEGRDPANSPWGGHADQRVLCGRMMSISAIQELLRRKLPFTQDEIQSLVEWSTTVHCYPAESSIARALLNYAAQGGELDDRLRKAGLALAEYLRDRKLAKAQVVAIEQLCAAAAPDDASGPPPESLQPPPQPAAAGVPTILVDLKHRLGLISDVPESPTREIGPDLFPLRDDSPLKDEHAAVSRLLEELVDSQDYSRPDLSRSSAAQELLSGTPAELGRVLLAFAERAIYARMFDVEAYNPTQYRARYSAWCTLPRLAAHPFSLPRAELFDLILYMYTATDSYNRIGPETVDELLQLVERDTQATPLSEGERYTLSRLRASQISGPLFCAEPPAIAALNRLINDGARFCLVPDEAWADAVNAEITALPPVQRRAWTALFQQAFAATASRPSAKWLKESARVRKAVGDSKFRAALQRWLPLVSKGRSQHTVAPFVGDARSTADTMIDENATCLRGLLWMIPALDDPDDFTRLVSAVAQSAYKKVPGVGPRAVKVGNAAVYALSEIATLNAVGQLAMLKVRVKFGTAQKEIEKAFTQSAEALGLPRDEIEELGVPSYGLESVGVLEETIGDYQARLQVNGSSADVQWSDANGKPLKSVPAKVRSEHKEELKELQQSLKDIQGMLPAQRDRIDGMFLLQKTWPCAVWKERYLEHPLIGTIVRRLIWCIDDRPALPGDGTPQDVDGAAIPVRDDSTVRLWHPIDRPIDEITAWRERLEQLQVTQPFKQAYREVYLLTDAERNTRTYSNRFAAHVVRQHQFNALCAARGWKNSLRLMVDASYEPPTKFLPLWGLRAEYWVEGIGDGYGVDTNDSGAFLRLATDQVRFYRTGAAANHGHAGGGGYAAHAAGPGADNINEPLPLDQVPPLVLSEIMRDVDLFVGVASVGNDPTWQDGGPDGRYLNYWQSYSFGELSGTAATRKQVLERLIPRLKIAPQCSFSDRFLIVRGSKRTYKIHLGSGNILMEPNDQYLCIVPDARSRAAGGDMYLPFEGDQTLSIIVSKALLLADDAKIKDPSITSQIQSHLR